MANRQERARESDGLTTEELRNQLNEILVFNNNCPIVVDAMGQKEHLRATILTTVHIPHKNQVDILCRLIEEE